MQNWVEPALPEGDPDPGRTGSSTTGQILVVDDEPMIQRLIARVLSTDGYSVDSTGDAETAWSMLQEKHYDCILMDWKMPGLTGRELYHLIEDRDRKIANRCIFISGHTANPEVDQFISLNKSPILIKPFSIETLRAVVDALLNSSPARR